MMRIRHLGSIWDRPLSVDRAALDFIRDGRCVSMGFAQIRRNSQKFAEIGRNSPKLPKDSPEIRQKFVRNSPEPTQ